jgi:hypothetical protein
VPLSADQSGAPDQASVKRRSDVTAANCPLAIRLRATVAGFRARLFHGPLNHCCRLCPMHAPGLLAVVAAGMRQDVAHGANPPGANFDRSNEYPAELAPGGTLDGVDDAIVNASSRVGARLGWRARLDRYQAPTRLRRTMLSDPRQYAITPEHRFRRRRGCPRSE